MAHRGAWWKRATPTTNTETFRQCTPFKLPSLGTIQLSPGHTITLETDAVFTPQCPMTEQSQVNNENNQGGVINIADLRDPFHASITPQAYATGAATVVAWMLVIMLLITPRTFFVGGGGTSGRSGLMGRRGMISGATGGGSIIGVGTRPWLQKVAALTVAVSLTIATADTFEIAEVQYENGYMDAMKLRDEVVSGMEIKVSRVISDIFLWLAQVQTLIRLFPRHKEKVIIKWVGFALILLDITFTSLNSFGPYNDKRSPRNFETAIPALSYLFQLSLSMLYAAWVMYYAITKRRVAFYHAMMPNISLVALLSIVAILTPVVFFITDISNYTIAGWGDYFRWVGAAAASVIVWEWVERIEALEREERKDGILGREIYDGDEMLDTTPSEEFSRRSWLSDTKKSDGSGGSSAVSSGHRSRLNDIAHRLGNARRPFHKPEAHQKRTIHIPAPAPAARKDQRSRRNRNSPSINSVQSPPPAIVSPVSRVDTTSADSTVYTVRYHPITETPPVPLRHVQDEERASNIATQDSLEKEKDKSDDRLPNADPEKGLPTSEGPTSGPIQGRWNLHALTNMNPFRRGGRLPPPEVQRGRVIEPLGVEDVSLNVPQRNYTGLALKDRLGTFAAQQGEKFRSKKNTAQQVELNLPVTIIPAQPRGSGRTWSPEILLQQQSEDASDGAGAQTIQDSPRSIPPPSSSPTQARNSPSTGNGAPSSPELRIGSPSVGPTSRIRFTPESFRHTARQQIQAPHRSPTNAPAALGNEVHNAQGHTVGSQQDEDASNPRASLTRPHQARSDHDR